MTDAEWADLCHAQAAASPGPWWMQAVATEAGRGGWAVIGGDGDHLLSPGDTGVREWADARLMAEAPALFGEVARLRGAAVVAADERRGLQATLKALGAEALRHPWPRAEGEDWYVGTERLDEEYIQDGGQHIAEGEAAAWAHVARVVRAVLGGDGR